MDSDDDLLALLTTMFVRSGIEFSVRVMIPMILMIEQAHHSGCKVWKDEPGEGAPSSRLLLLLQVATVLHLHLANPFHWWMWMLKL